jgi:hypothetical protein
MAEKQKLDDAKSYLHPMIVQVNTQSKSMVCPSLRKNFRQQRIHNICVRKYSMSEHPRVVSHRQHEICQFPKSLSTWPLSCRSSDSPSLGPHVAPGSILLNAGIRTQISFRSLWPASEMNRALSLPKLALVARRFQVGDGADPKSTHEAPIANRSLISIIITERDELAQQGRNVLIGAARCRIFVTIITCPWRNWTVGRGRINIESMSWIDIIDNHLASLISVDDADKQESKTRHRFWDRKKRSSVWGLAFIVELK